MTIEDPSNEESGKSDDHPVSPEPVPVPTQDSSEPPTISKKPVSEFNDDEMRTLINSLSPREYMEAGITFLTFILDNEGSASVVKFVRKAHDMLHAEGKFNPYDFDKNRPGSLGYSAAYNRVRSMDRRAFLATAVNDFLTTYGWLIPGLVGYVISGTQVIRQSYHVSQRYFFSRQNAPKEKSPINDNKDSVERALDSTEGVGLKAVSISELLVSIALIREGMEGKTKIEKKKLDEIEKQVEQIANAVAEIAKHMDLEIPVDSKRTNNNPNKDISH